MADTNIVILCGRLTKDIELKYAQSGTCVGHYTIAVGRNVKHGDKWEKESHFFDATIMGKMAESLKDYLKKGQQVVLHGSLRQERWEKNGQKYSKIGIMTENLQLVGGKKEDGNAMTSSQQRRFQQQSQPQQQVQDFNGSDFTEDIPF